MKLVKRTVNNEDKFYFVDAMFIKGSEIVTPHVSGYYASAMPVDLFDDADINNPRVIDIDILYDEFEALQLLCEVEHPNEKSKSIADSMVTEELINMLINEVEEKIKKDDEEMKKLDNMLNTYWYGNINARLNDTGSNQAFMGKKEDKKDDDKGEKSDVTLKDVAGLEEIKVELKELIMGFKDKEKFEKFKVTPPRGVLLEGDPGNGKSLIARAIAGETDAAFYSMAGSEFDCKYIGVGSENIRKLFNKARNNKPAVIFLDEIDAVGSKREDENSKERNATLNQLLVEIASPKNEDILIIGATNRKDILDPALIRQGRLSRHIYIPNPDERTRKEILELYAKDRPMAEDVDLESVASQTYGMSGADMEGILTEAAMLAIREDADEITQDMLLRAIDRQIAGLERKSTVMMDREKKITAYHEVGHLVVSRVVGDRKLSKCTIVPHGDALGYCLYHEEGDRFIRTKDELMNSMMTSLGGAVSEKVFFNHESSGCAGDLGSVSNVAKHMVCDYGMSSLGKMKINENNLFMQEKIHEEMKKIVDEAYDKTLEIVKENKQLIQMIAEELEVKETLNENEIDDLVAAFKIE